MNRAPKAVLLSALVFPGSGQLYLKQYLAGSILIAIALACLYQLLSTAMTIAQSISAQIESGEIPADVALATSAILERTANPEVQASVATYALIACWLVSIIGAWYSGRKHP